MTAPTPQTLLTPQQIADALQAAAGDGFLSARCTEWAEGTQGRKSHQVWLHITRDALLPALERLIAIHYPHFAVIASADVGDAIELMYHLYVYWGHPGQEILVTFTVQLDKTDLTIPSICHLIPGALIAEREKIEMVGVTITGIPDNRRLFLPEDFPEGIYPWRNDETGIPPDMIKNLWATGRDDITYKYPAPPPEETIPTDENAAPEKPAPPPATPET